MMKSIIKRHAITVCCLVVLLIVFYTIKLYIPQTMGIDTIKTQLSGEISGFNQRVIYNVIEQFIAAIAALIFITILSGIIRCILNKNTKEVK